MGRGVYAADPNKWFYIAEFHEMIDEVPEAKQLIAVISQIHKASMGKSPTGMYGFYATTHIAVLPNDNTWAFLSRIMTGMIGMLSMQCTFIKLSQSSFFTHLL